MKAILFAFEIGKCVAILLAFEIGKCVAILLAKPRVLGRLRWTNLPLRFPAKTAWRISKAKFPISPIIIKRGISIFRSRIPAVRSERSCFAEMLPN